MAQTKSITGIIKDADGEVLIGATIMEIGDLANGTTAGIDGRFSLQIKSGSSIRVSYIGYATVDLKTGVESNVDVVLELDEEHLDEVVIVGYGTLRRSSMTGLIT